MAIVKFLPSEIEVEVPAGETLFRAAQSAGVPIASVCGGQGNCSGCRLKILEGEDHLSPMGYKEQGLLGNTFFITKERLACQTTTEGPLVVEVLQEQVRDKRGRARRRAMDRTLEDAKRRADRQAEADARKARARRGGPKAEAVHGPQKPPPGPGEPAGQAGPSAGSGPGQGSSEAGPRSTVDGPTRGRRRSGRRRSPGSGRSPGPQKASGDRRQGGPGEAAGKPEASAGRKGSSPGSQRKRGGRGRGGGGGRSGGGRSGGGRSGGGSRGGGRGGSGRG